MFSIVILFGLNLVTQGSSFFVTVRQDYQITQRVAPVNRIKSSHVQSMTCSQFNNEDDEVTSISAVQSRRNLLSRTASFSAISIVSALAPASAIGPVTMEFDDIKYEPVECPKNFGGKIGGSFGGSASRDVKQQCIQMTATVTNPTKKTFEGLRRIRICRGREDRCFGYR